MKHYPLCGKGHLPEVVILADGNFPRTRSAVEMLKRLPIVCCDGATGKLLRHGYKPHAIVGDGDSLSSVLRKQYASIIHLEKEQETNDLSNYLDKEIELYYVLLVDGKVVGCGRINFAEKRTIGKISWDIIHPDYQGKSLGRKLLMYRIEVLKAIPGIKKIIVRTSQLAYKFYEKQGFTLNEIKRNYWADGFDMYSMQYNEL